MLNARSIQGIIAIVLGLFFAIWLGMALVTDQFETLLQVAGAVLLITAAYLGQRVWLMFIFFTSMNVMLYRWAGTVEIGQIIFIVFTLALFLMRKLRFEIRFTELEFWALLIIACIVQTYVRHPVGLNVLGAGNVGGRPYVALALCIISCAMLSVLVIPPNQLKWAMRLSVIGGLLGIPLQLARYGNLYGTEEEYTRIPSFNVCALVLSGWINSRISPLKACLRPLWALAILVTLALAASSGYRSSVATVGFIYFIGVFYHGGFGSLLASLLMATFALSLLAVVNLNFPLPGNIQRALSPLPGTWEERYRQAGEASTEWRVEMWKEALFTDRWISDKILGDGIGLSAEQLERQLSTRETGRTAGGLTVQQITMLELGSYHSGPVHSVRMVGYVGLVILLLAMSRLAVHAHRQIMRCKGTEWAPVGLFFGVPLIVQPIVFTFIFGEYHIAVASTLLGTAMIRLMERNLPLPAYAANRRHIHVPLALRARNA